MTCDEHITPEQKLGYTEWHDRAHEWEKTRKKKRTLGGQVQCTTCKRFFFPWEMKASARAERNV